MLRTGSGTAPTAATRPVELEARLLMADFDADNPGLWTAHCRAAPLPRRLIGYQL
ncbi:hypothetical protein [Streptomyces virginiae]|uniref:hypothetical protein n=1 Tax=Streptomyces virginiae TaxID=1961 RepID=UPI0036F922C7